MTTLTVDQVQYILGVRESVKNLSALQKQEKDILRKPHDKAVWNDGKMTWKGIDAASWLMGRTRNRADEISALLIAYNKARGKEWRMHEKKSK